MGPVTIAAVPAAQSVALAGEIERRLLDALSGINRQSANVPIVLAARDGAGALVGGLTGATSYGWLLVKTLWVAEGQRGSGIGSRLMQAAEDAGRAAGCHGAWLDTSNAGARAFYVRLGYADFGQLDNGPGQVPEGHVRWFMKKPL